MPARALSPPSSQWPFDPSQADLYYAESLSLVEYLIKTYGEANLGQLIAAYRDELSYDEALQAAYGIDTDTLDRQWKASLGYQGDRPGGPVAARGDGGYGDARLLPGGEPAAPAEALPLGLSLAALTLIAAGGLVARRRRPAA